MISQNRPGQPPNTAGDRTRERPCGGFQPDPSQERCPKQRRCEGAEGRTPPSHNEDNVDLKGIFRKPPHILNPENYRDTHTQDKVRTLSRREFPGRHENITELDGGPGLPPPPLHPQPQFFPKRILTGS